MRTKRSFLIFEKVRIEKNQSRWLVRFDVNASNAKTALRLFLKKNPQIKEKVFLVIRTHDVTRLSVKDNKLIDN